MGFFSQFILIIPGILMAITIHEYAHGWMANRLGDPTARYAGRLTLNPLHHLDPIGTLMLFIAHIGWAKPVPINPQYFSNPKYDIIWVSLAGPMANIICAFACGALFRFFINLSTLLAYIFMYAVLINLVLCAFNIIPIPPLDGSKILMGILPRQQAYEFSKLEPFGPFILLFIIMFGRMTGFNIIWSIISRFVTTFSYLFTGEVIGI
ncbi:MAG: site-2 protease family protein [bacterium]|nr:site-2 protease family protein [bacterium]